MSRPGAVIRVLLVDDSGLVREMLREILDSQPGIVVVGEASDGAEAVALVVSLKPDIVTMDIEMPVMGGLEAIERIIAEFPVPILVVTALTGVRTAFAAVSKGALDVIEKTDIGPENIANLVKKIRLLAKVNVTKHLQMVKAPTTVSVPDPVKLATSQSVCGVVVVAASTGGPQAIKTVLSRLPANFPLPIVISQHIAAGFTQGMVDWLKSGTPLVVRVAEHGDRLTAGHVYVNPAEHAMMISAQETVVLAPPDDRQIYHPSCNTLISSIAAVYRERAIGVIMSGMGDDGVSGMAAIRKAGGVTLAQDAASSVIFGMNRLAVERGCIDVVMSLTDIPAELLQRAGGR